MSISSVSTSLPYQATTNQISATQAPGQPQQVQGVTGQTTDSTRDESETAVKAAAGNDVGRMVNVTA